jgi:aryl carrier-like protein
MSTISFLSRRARKAASTTGDAGAPGQEPEQDIDLEALEGIWKKTLRVDRVSPDDNLFELGGTSLHAMLLASQVERFSATLDLVGFLETPTFDGLCANIRVA